MSDVRDIMQLPTASTPQHQLQIQQLSAPARSSSTSDRARLDRKPDGVSRELYSLIGGVPPLMPAVSLSKSKSTWKKKAVRWEWRSFTNSARKDSLSLRHWVRADSDQGDYSFAKLNKVLDIPKYDDTDYRRLLQDPNWSKEETDTLFDLCRTFDLRFVMIHDRYPPQYNRTMEDLKDRYYTVVRTLIRARSSTGLVESQLAELSNFDYDKVNEIERKKHLEMLFSRSPAQVKEEEMLLLEAKRIDQNAKRFLKERGQILKLLHSVDNSPMLMNQIRKSISSGSILAGPAPRPIKPGGYMRAFIPGRPRDSDVAVVRGLPNIRQKRVGISDPSLLAASGGSAIAGVLGDGSDALDADLKNKKEKIPPGIWARSSRLQPVRINMAKKVDTFLEELGLTVRPIIPTASVCAEFEELRTMILTLLDLKKHTDKVETELEVAFRRRALLLGQEPPAAGVAVQEALRKAEITDSLESSAASGASSSIVEDSIQVKSESVGGTAGAGQDPSSITGQRKRSFSSPSTPGRPPADIKRARK